MNKKINCLMLKTTDQRCFFTHKDNYPQLVEFARTCEAEISVVKANNVKILELAELAKSICNHGKQSVLPQYEIMEIKLPNLPEIKISRNRKNIIEHAKTITNHVNKSFLNNEIVSLSDLENKFAEFNLSKAALCNHIARVRTNLAKKGYQISKIKRGQYKLSTAQIV